jgi:prephenate dehydrogenase
MKQIAILGPGLLGGSIAKAFRQDANVRVHLWARREEAVREAQSLEVADHVTSSLGEAVQGADTVLLCVPVGAMPAIVRQILPVLSPDALVTDVGSVKEVVCRELGPMLQGRAHFIGSHPMAGSEKAGISAARADLFQAAVCILTPEEGRTPPEVLRRATVFWERLGCRVRTLAPGAHDQICAIISHLPHLSAAALVNVVESVCPEAFGFCGSGFRDSTRIAAGLPSMWTEILLSNRTAVAESLRQFIAILEHTAAQLEKGDAPAEAALHGFLAAAKTRRENLTGLPAETVPH